LQGSASPLTTRLAARRALALAAIVAAAALAASGGGGAPALRNAVVAQLAPAAGTQATTSGPAAPAPCWQSSNWSGYAVSSVAVSGIPCVPATGQTYTKVGGSWTVPQVRGVQGQRTFSGTWIGIDGFTDADLIQTGTEQDFTGGTDHYSAWWEILPAAEKVIPAITVEPGDSMTASIAKTTANRWTITITDNGQPGHPAQPPFSITKAYSGPGTSAEWIMEAPTVNNRQAAMANYGETSFDLGTANGVSPSLQPGTGGETVQQASGIFAQPQVVSIPSEPDTGAPAGDGFALGYGFTPSAPTS
jgi:hypothetical protein